MYSLIRVWIGLKLARMQIHVRVVVNTTRAADMPSTPSLYWMPKRGIQSTRLDVLEAGADRRQVADEQDQRDDPGHERHAEGGRRAHDRPGRIATTIAPTSGAK